ncbi:MAG: hypothetical protein H6741_27255 [Alphaproteobacteria bacterium]|nr:hypothetical protein [Alphaproteobacteria bacterium]
MWLLLLLPLASAAPPVTVVDFEADAAATLSPLERRLLELSGGDPTLEPARLTGHDLPLPSLHEDPGSAEALREAALRDLIVFFASAGESAEWPCYGGLPGAERRTLTLLAEEAEAQGLLSHATTYRLQLIRSDSSAASVDALARVALASGRDEELNAALWRLQALHERGDLPLTPEAVQALITHQDTLAVRRAAWAHLEALRLGEFDAGVDIWTAAVEARPQLLARPEVLLMLWASGVGA